MREILLRGKRIDNGEWVEGCLLIDYISGQYFIHANGNSVNESEKVNEEGCLKFVAFEVEPKTVCQYTGLTDKNGRKIFEGDICKTHYANAKRNEFVETIAFNGGRFCAYQDKDGCKSWAGLYDGVPHLAIDKSVYMDEIEVIGNIVDNSELLRGGANE